MSSCPIAPFLSLSLLLQIPGAKISGPEGSTTVPLPLHVHGSSHGNLAVSLKPQAFPCSAFLAVIFSFDKWHSSAIFITHVINKKYGDLLLCKIFPSFSPSFPLPLTSFTNWQGSESITFKFISDPAPFQHLGTYSFSFCPSFSLL